MLFLMESGRIRELVSSLFLLKEVFMSLIDLTITSR